MGFTAVNVPSANPLTPVSGNQDRRLTLNANHKPSVEPYRMHVPLTTSRALSRPYHDATTTPSNISPNRRPSQDIEEGSVRREQPLRATKLLPSTEQDGTRPMIPSFGKDEHDDDWYMVEENLSGGSSAASPSQQNRQNDRAVVDTEPTRRPHEAATSSLNAPGNPSRQSTRGSVDRVTKGQEILYGALSPSLSNEEMQDKKYEKDGLVEIDSISFRARDDARTRKNVKRSVKLEDNSPGIGPSKKREQQKESTPSPSKRRRTTQEQLLHDEGTRSNEQNDRLAFSCGSENVGMTQNVSNDKALGVAPGQRSEDMTKKAQQTERSSSKSKEKATAYAPSSDPDGKSLHRPSATGKRKFIPGLGVKFNNGHIDSQSKSAGESHQIRNMRRREVVLPNEPCRCGSLPECFREPDLKFPRVEDFEGCDSEFLAHVGQIANCPGHNPILTDSCRLILMSRPTRVTPETARWGFLSGQPANTIFDDDDAIDFAEDWLSTLEDDQIHPRVDPDSVACFRADINWENLTPVQEAFVRKQSCIRSDVFYGLPPKFRRPPSLKPSRNEYISRKENPMMETVNNSIPSEHSGENTRETISPVPPPTITTKKSTHRHQKARHKNRQGSSPVTPQRDRHQTPPNSSPSMMRRRQRERSIGARQTPTQSTSVAKEKTQEATPPASSPSQVRKEEKGKSNRHEVGNAQELSNPSLRAILSEPGTSPLLTMELQGNDKYPKSGRYSESTTQARQEPPTGKLVSRASSSATSSRPRNVQQQSQIGPVADQNSPIRNVYDIENVVDVGSRDVERPSTISQAAECDIRDRQHRCQTEPTGPANRTKNRDTSQTTHLPQNSAIKNRALQELSANSRLSANALKQVGQVVGSVVERAVKEAMREHNRALAPPNNNQASPNNPPLSQNSGPSNPIVPPTGRHTNKRSHQTQRPRSLRDVAAEDGLSVEQIIEAGKLRTGQERRTAAPQAFGSRGRLFSRYNELLGKGVWSSEQITRMRP